jgi:hypothetical protein
VDDVNARIRLTRGGTCGGDRADLDQWWPRERPRHGIVRPFSPDTRGRLANEGVVLAVQRNE